MSEHLDLLQRAANRGTPRGIDRVVADARHHLRRRRQQGIAVAAGVALVGTGIMTTGLPDRNSTTAVASSQDDDFVAVVPDLDRFELITGTEPERFESPEGQNGNIAIYQRLSEDGSVAAAVAVAVVTDKRQQGTLLDYFGFSAGETTDGNDGTYPVSDHDEYANGLVIVERTTPTHTIRVAGRHLDVAVTVEVLESVELGADGTIARIELPEDLPAEPVYAGADISRIAQVPDLYSAGHYRDLDSGQQFTIVTARDRSVLPAESLAWWYGDGSLLSENAFPTVVGENWPDSHVAYWRLDPGSSMTVYSDKPLTPELIRQIQTNSQALDGAAWAGLIEGRTQRTQTTGTEPPPTTTTVP